MPHAGLQKPRSGRSKLHEMTVLKDLVEHHVENEIFPLAERKLASRSGELAEQMEGSEAHA